MPNSIGRLTSSRAARLACLAALLACACSDPPPKREWTPADHGQPAGGDPDRTPEPDNSAVDGGEDPLARAAAALWNASCASCHGRDGRGQGAGRPPGAQMADFTSPSFQGSRSDEQLSVVIRDGRGMMPSFGKQVNEHGLGALVQHIRRLGAAPEAQQPAP
jgi:mono/diheme cytochrome c family protein